MLTMPSDGIVEHDDLDRQPVAADSVQLVRCHHQAAVAAAGQDVASRTSEVRSHGHGQRAAHAAHAARCDADRGADDGNHCGALHLVRAHVEGGHGVCVRLLQRLGHLTIDELVAEGLALRYVVALYGHRASNRRQVVKPRAGRSACTEPACRDQALERIAGRRREWPGRPRARD